MVLAAVTDQRPGVIPPMFTIAGVRGIQFYSYGEVKYTLDDWLYDHTGVSPLETCNNNQLWPSVQTVGCFSLAGAFSGAISTVFSCK